MSKMNRHIIWQFFTRFGASLFNLLIGILISRYLGTEGRGTHGLFIASIALIHLCTNWLGGASLVYLAPRYSLKQLTRISFWWSSLFASATWFLLYLIGILPGEYNGLLLICALLFAWWNNLANLLLGRQQTQAYNTLQVINPMISVAILVIAFLLYKPLFLSFVWAYAMAQAISLGLSLFYLRKELAMDEKRNDPGLLRVFIRHGLYIQLANLTQFFNYRIVYFLIDSHFGKSTLGIYSNALSLAESVWMITRSISTIQFAKISNSTDIQFSRNLTRRYGTISIVVSSIGVLTLTLLPDTFFTWLFGAEFTGIHDYLVLLAPAILSMSFGNIYAHYFSGLGLNRVNFVGSLFNLVVMVIAFYLLMDVIGVQAAPVSASISFTLAMGYHVWRFRPWAMDHRG